MYRLCETNYRGTGCGKSARPGLWGSGEATNRSTRKKLLVENSINVENLTIYIRAFKQEKELELWAKNETDKFFKLIKTYEICRICGNFGPKRRAGDLQIPEGFQVVLPGVEPGLF